MEIIGTEIDWKEGQDPTRKEVKKTYKDKKTGEKQVSKKIIPCDSFFNIFRSLKEPDDA